jgi:selenocysteine-specific elongation factor
MSGSLTLGVIGHVDHGKSALVRALTGTETDRLREERERGLSIVLGFAFLETDHGVVDLIDVPGHEDFIRAMVAGATALDGIVLCVAANEGVMPQTVEHFNIARLLGVDKGIVVITKTDLVDAEMLALAREDIHGLVRGSFLEQDPMLETAALSGKGIDAARKALGRLAERPVERNVRGHCFLPLDRVFTMRGFGLVATGTLRGGNIAVGETVEILPAGRTATVRALQNHNAPVSEAVPGQRVAVNLRQVDRDEISRGDVLAAPGTIKPARRFDVELQLLDTAPAALRNGASVRFLTGTTDAIARVRLLDRQALTPGERALAQINLDRDVATVAYEHFLLRSHSPLRTIGGGRILEIDPQRHRRFDETVTRHLETIASGDLESLLVQRLEDSGWQGLKLQALAADAEQSADEIEAIVERLGVVRIGEHRVGARAYASLLEAIIASIGRFHETHAFSSGLDSGHLSGELGLESDSIVLRHALLDLANAHRIRNTNGSLSLADFDPFARLDQRERRLITEIEALFRDAGLEPPEPEAVLGSDKASHGVFGLLLETGRLVRLKTYKSRSNLVLHDEALANARRAIGQAFPYPATFALKDVRDLLGSSRKYIVPLMEHLDATGATARSGDLRRLREDTNR